MSLLVDASERTEKTEIMDDFSIEGPVLHDTLDKLSLINKWLGGTQVTIEGLKKLLKGQAKNEPLTIVDIGCGDGDILRKIADFGKQEGYSFHLVGIDANENTLDYARDLSQAYSSISYLNCDIFSEQFRMMEYDIVLSTLFLHHFKEIQLIDLLSLMHKRATLGIVVNDLHRHPLAYYLFHLVCLLIANKMVKEDGLTSILRGFKKNELELITRRIGAKSQIKWKWAFRYQWIIQKRT